MTDLRETIRQIIREEIDAVRSETVNKRYKMVRVNGVLSPQAGRVYVVPVDNEATHPEIVVNRRVAAVEGLEVIVHVDNTSNVWQVLDIFDSEIFDQAGYTGQTYQPLHAQDHRWTSQTNPPFNNPAVDAVSVGQRGFLPLRARPAAAGGTKLDITSFTYEFNGSWMIYPGATSFDLSAIETAITASKQLFTLVYLNKTTNTILTVNGSESIYSKIIRPAFPSLPSGKIEPIVLVRLYKGQTTISETYDIYDVRRVVGTAESDEVGTVSKVYAPNLTTEVITTDANSQVAITKELELSEMTAPSAPGTNDARLYAVDDGSGNSQLAVLFSSGLAQVLATQSAYLPYKISLSAMNFYLTEGTPSQGYIGESTQRAASTWLLDDAANETVSAGVQYTGTESGSTITIDVYWAMESATTGDVALQVRGMAAFADGEDFTTTGTNNSKTVAVAGTAQTLTLESFAIAESYAPNDIIRVSIRRQGGSGADTAAGDLHVIAATLKFS